eukprot:5651353-Ditylum_brightwellii.AAC.1
MVRMWKNKTEYTMPNNNKTTVGSNNPVPYDPVTKNENESIENEDKGAESDKTMYTISSTSNSATRAEGDTLVPYNSEPGHKNEHNENTPLFAETSEAQKKVKIKLMATII